MSLAAAGVAESDVDRLVEEDGIDTGTEVEVEAGAAWAEQENRPAVQ